MTTRDKPSTTRTSAHEDCLRLFKLIMSGESMKTAEMGCYGAAGGNWCYWPLTGVTISAGHQRHFQQQTGHVGGMKSNQPCDKCSLAFPDLRYFFPQHTPATMRVTFRQQTSEKFMRHLALMEFNCGRQNIRRRGSCSRRLRQELVQKANVAGS